MDATRGQTQEHSGMMDVFILLRTHRVDSGGVLDAARGAEKLTVIFFRKRLIHRETRVDSKLI